MKATKLIEWFEAARYKARHGDVVIVSDASAPADGKEVPRGVVADGEATGHAHRVDRAVVRQVVGDLMQRVIVVGKLGKGERATLDHEEHARRALPSGKFRTGIQQQYSPEGWSSVQD